MQDNNTVIQSVEVTKPLEPEILEIIENYHARVNLNEEFKEGLIGRINLYEEQKKTIIALSDDIAQVRDRDDLIRVLSSRLKGLFHFNHAVVATIDHQDETYAAFLVDYNTSPIKYDPKYEELLKSKYSVHFRFVAEILKSGVPDSVVINEVMDLPDSPPYFRVHYENGLRETLIAPLKSKMQTIGFMNIYSDRIGNFTNEFKATVQAIAPQLSNAISNIIANEEIMEKEFVNEQLLLLGNSLAGVRHKKELLKVLNSGLRTFINFSHSVITTTNEAGDTYSAFVLDDKADQKNITKFNEAISAINQIEDGIYNIAMNSHSPIVIDMKSLDLRKTPLWYRFNYATGTRSMMIKVFPNGDTARFGLILFSDQQDAFSEKTLNIIERISDQVSSVARNILANEQLQEREAEKSFLLEFSKKIAAVRSKTDLLEAVRYTLKKLNLIKGYVIRKIDEDGTTMSAYIHDGNIVYEKNPDLSEISKSKFAIRDGIQDRVLSGNVPILFDIDEEISKGNIPKYLDFWKKMGFSKMVGTPLRTGNEELGILWLGTEEINFQLLKGICAQISIAMSNIIANEQIQDYKQRLEIENVHLHEQIKTLYNFSEIIGNGTEMQKVYNLMGLVAPSNTTVMILGETGTGKELIARAIHNFSPRKDKLMVKVNCATLPPNLIESELFGHEKGSFTGAHDRRIGKFELAHGGSIFLDEVGELPLELQVKMLRVIQEREFERIGGGTTIKVDVRIIAATNRNLLSEVNQGRFRSDLFYRLNVFPILLPPLRERIEDIEPLANFFLNRYSKITGKKIDSISPAAIQKLKNYSWPGNVRELEHLIERSILLSTGAILQEIHLPENARMRPENLMIKDAKSLHDMERMHILKVLKSCDGKISGAGGAAELLDVPASTLHSKMKKLRISRAHYISTDS